MSNLNDSSIVGGLVQSEEVASHPANHRVIFNQGSQLPSSQEMLSQQMIKADMQSNATVQINPEGKRNQKRASVGEGV